MLLITKKLLFKLPFKYNEINEDLVCLNCCVGIMFSIGEQYITYGAL